MNGYDDIPIVCPWCSRQVPQRDWVIERAKCKDCDKKVFVCLDPKEVEYCIEIAKAIEKSNMETGIHKPLNDPDQKSIDAGINATCAECAFHKFVGKPFVKKVERGHGDDGDFHAKGLVLDIKACCNERFRGIRINMKNYAKRQYDGYIAMKKVLDCSHEFWEVVGTITKESFANKHQMVVFKKDIPAMHTVFEEHLNHPSKIKKWLES